MHTTLRLIKHLSIYFTIGSLTTCHSAFLSPCFFIDSLRSHSTWRLWTAHHFANIHYTSNDANRNHDSDDQIANPDLAAAIFLRGSCEIGLLVEKDWHHDEADAADAATE